MRTIKNGDLLVPLTDDAKQMWGRGIVTEAMRLDYPPAHLVHWFGHNRQIVIEEALIFGNFEVIGEQEN